MFRKYNDVNPVLDSCYNLFTAWTGNGKELWVLKVYGSGKVYVQLNGKEVDQTSANATGAVGFNFSPTQVNTNHSIFELSFAASPGWFGVQLHDPGPRFGCEVVETEPATFTGNLNSVGGGLTVMSMDSRWWDPTATWCHAGLPKGTACKQIPDVFPGSTTNPNWANYYGPDHRIKLAPAEFDHTCDGKFTGFQVGGGLDEWNGIQPAIGQFTHAYFNYDGTRLHILNDWYVVNPRNSLREHLRGLLLVYIYSFPC